MKKLTINDPLKKHLRVLGYLLVSALIAYGASLIASNPAYLYFAPVINYVLYAIDQEVRNEGVIKKMLKK